MVFGYISSYIILYWEIVFKIGLVEVKGGIIFVFGKNIIIEMVWRGKVSEYSIRILKCYVLWLFDVE